MTHSSDFWWQTSFDLMMVYSCQVRIIWARITAIDYLVTLKMVSLSRRKKSLPNTWYIPNQKKLEALENENFECFSINFSRNEHRVNACFVYHNLNIFAYIRDASVSWNKPLLSLCCLELNRCARNCSFRSSRSSSSFSKFESQLCCKCKSWLSFHNVIDLLSYVASWFEIGKQEFKMAAQVWTVDMIL